MSDYVLSSFAEADVAYIWLYIANDRPLAADQLTARLTEAFDFLARNPHVGQARPKLGKRVRAFSVGEYVVYFKPANDVVEIIRVIHGARRIKNLNKID